MPSVAIIGASSNRAKYGNKAVRAYQEAGWTVFPVNPNSPVIEGLPTYARLTDVSEHIDRVALYLPPIAGLTVLSDIAQVKPRELFFNPGSESEELIVQANALGLRPTLGCAIIAIGKQPSTYH